MRFRKVWITAGFFLAAFLIVVGIKAYSVNRTYPAPEKNYVKENENIYFNGCAIKVLNSECLKPTDCSGLFEPDEVLDDENMRFIRITLNIENVSDMDSSVSVMQLKLISDLFAWEMSFRTDRSKLDKGEYVTLNPGGSKEVTIYYEITKGFGYTEEQNKNYHKDWQDLLENKREFELLITGYPIQNICYLSL